MEVRNSRVTESSYAKDVTLLVSNSIFYRNSSFELLTRLRKTLNFTSSYSKIKLLFFHFRVTNSKLENKSIHFELLIQRDLEFPG